ncbi:MAG: prephenate dehydrogenase/arogenate dehydrogenase family protein [Verrucomicrobiae bacterium]|nr:prephenate dehydrogenase/arogenate dehydrogenase family protein [Verrucomicrobiae bacterium]
MKTPLIQRLAILGPGLLGGSIGLAARQRRVAKRIVVWGRRAEAAHEAVTRGAAHEVARTPADAVRNADLIVLCMTVEAMPAVARALRPGLKRGALVTDVGSTKRSVVRRVGAVLGGKAAWIGSHPMAGGERVGLRAAHANLFADAMCFVTPLSDSSAAAVAKLIAFWEALGGRVTALSPARHDAVAALISHVPHLTAAALVNLVGRREPAALGGVGNGFRDMTRIAAGAPEMWAGIAKTNRKEIRRGIGLLIEELRTLERTVAHASWRELHALLRRAKEIRDGLRPRRRSSGE